MSISYVQNAQIVLTSILNLKPSKASRQLLIHSVAGLMWLATRTPAFFLASNAYARTLNVGDGAAYARPSDAARVAQPGDRIRIQPGTYYDCAVWSVDGLVIEGAGPETILTDTICQGKAIFVTTGRGITVQDLVLARARARDENGAGIRAEGPDLRVYRVRFENNQNGLLAPDLPAGELRIENCVFVHNGAFNVSRPTASLLVGSWAHLIIQGSRFEQDRGQATVFSRARLTEITGSRISVPEALEGAAIHASGGLTVERSILELEGRPDFRRIAIRILPASPSSPLILRHNVLQGTGTLLLNWSGRSSITEANQLNAGSILETTSGVWAYRLRSNIRAAYSATKAVARTLKLYIAEQLLR